MSEEKVAPRSGVEDIIPFEVEKDKLIISLPEYLAQILDSYDWREVKYKSKEARLKVQSVLNAFLYHLSNADNVLWWYDKTIELLHGNLYRVLKDVGVCDNEATDLANKIEQELSFLRIWYWNTKTAVAVGKKALSYLDNKYPEIITYAVDCSVKVEIPSIGYSEVFQFVDC